MADLMMTIDSDSEGPKNKKQNKKNKEVVKTKDKEADD
jgi:hypothetical protein